jgi:hypothetical protein
MRNIIPVLFLLSLALWPALAPAQATGQNTGQTTGALMTGKSLSLLCSSDKQDDVFSCQNYIAGIVDYHRLLKSLGNAPSVDFCPPPTATLDQMRRIVAAYIQKHTEHQDFIAAPGVAMSLYAAYPCAGRTRYKN